ncbi:DUF4099 domain-containing protein [Limibacterium fermenti]|uniref:DUF4099 domain-containing protein n=1 Tax=Limibacterium fermenti TaxID=3229863 RepID=UPI003A72FE35
MDESKLKDQNILLVKEKGSDELKAVAGIGKNGKLETVEAKAENASRFLMFDRNNRNELAGIMSDFNRKAGNPKDFQLFQVHYGKFEKLKEGLEEVLSLPHNPEGKELLKKYEVNSKDFAAKQAAEDPKVLLTQGEDGKLKAIAGEGKDGKLKTVDPTKENAGDFLKIDTRGNALENFFKKFSEQLKNPFHTGIYAVSANAVDKIAAFFDKIIKIDPADKVLDPYRVTPEGKMQEQAQGRYQPLDLNKLDWKEADKLGLSGQSLQDALKAMSYGHKSPGLIEVRMEIDGKELQAKARLSFEQQADGTIKIQTHPFQEKPDFEKPFMGVLFTPDEQKQLTTTGHGGRAFELEMTPGGEKVPALVSLDKITNRIEAVPLSEIQIPKMLKGVELSEKQQEGLKNGQGVLVENMDKKQRPGEEPGGKITRIVQYNAVNKNFDFLFTPEQRQQRQQERAAKAEQHNNQPLKPRKVDNVWIRPVQGGVELSREQFKELLNNKPVFVEGLIDQTKLAKQEQGAQQTEATDKKGQKYNAWVWPDQDAGRIRHTSLPPDQWKEAQAKKQAQPAEGFKTQVAVNNEGKTNEATKQSTDPLKKGQAQPTEKQAAKKEEKQQQEQRQSPAKPKKRTGHKL